MLSKNTNICALSLGLQCFFKDIRNVEYGNTVCAYNHHKWLTDARSQTYCSHASSLCTSAKNNTPPDSEKQKLRCRYTLWQVW